MTRIPMNDLGTKGIVKDLDAHSLPLDVWSEGRNIRFDDNKAVKFRGEEIVFASPSVPPYFAMPVQTADSVLWIYAGLSKAYVFQGGTHTNITRIKTSPSFIPPPGELIISLTIPSRYPGVDRPVPVEQLTITTSAPTVVAT
ncbi:hypothetical protein LCGC14_2965060 [marine sediment metagenome]|uniref:Uncharacterized protein n=1 Tax=marine sediment metagenome TaxID=412755 RepID=A0A0F8XB14_9ZZZZ